MKKIRKAVWVESILVLILMAAVFRQHRNVGTESSAVSSDYIKWVDFNVCYEALCDAYHWDVETHDTEHPVDWIELLACTAARSGGEFDRKAMKDLRQTAEKLAKGEKSIEELTEKLKYYDYYREAYSAVLGGLVGEFREEYEDADGSRTYRDKYGLKAFFRWQKGLITVTMMISEPGGASVISADIWGTI